MAEPLEFLDIENTRIDQIIPYELNPRVHTPESVSAIAASIREFGFRQPIVVDRDGVIVAGHGRYAAAKKLGLELVPVHWARDLDPVKASALRVADNKVAEYSDWDWQKLSAELRALQAAGATADQIEALGFSSAELKVALAGATPQADDHHGSLAEEFGVAPFSVLNAREGWWQARKDSWIALGIQSELGRGENSAPGGSPRPLDRAKASASPMSGGDKNIARERKNTRHSMGGGANSANYKQGKRLAPAEKAAKAAISKAGRAASPGGSPRPAMDYSTKARGDGRGRPIT